MARTLKTALDEANPNRLPSACQALPLGSFLAGGICRVVARPNPATGVYALPEGVKAQQAFFAVARDAATPGVLGPGAPYTPPGPGTVGTSPTGDIACA